jgi:hypothetical protein
MERGNGGDEDVVSLQIIFQEFTKFDSQNTVNCMYSA